MKSIRDRQLRHINELQALVLAEHKRQIAKWGVQNALPFAWMTYLTEEVGELAEAITNDAYGVSQKDCVVAEAIQVATLALKIAEMYR